MTKRDRIKRLVDRGEKCAAGLRSLGLPATFESGVNWLDAPTSISDPTLEPFEIEGHRHRYWIGGMSPEMDAQVAAANAVIGYKFVGDFAWARLYRTNGEFVETSDSILVWLGYPGAVSGETHDHIRFLEAAEELEQHAPNIAGGPLKPTREGVADSDWT